MFRIRRIYDWTTHVNKQAIDQVQDLIRTQFYLEKEETILEIPRQLQDPMTHTYRSIVFVAEDQRIRVIGFAILLHFPDLRFCFLNYISAAPGRTGRGIGGALYNRVRTEAMWLKTKGIFMECPQDTPGLDVEKEVQRKNRDRLRFYERFGARPIINTKYETPLKPEDPNPPFIVFDDLGRGRRLKKREAREIVRAVLERKYQGFCPPDYVEMVVRSFNDDPVRLREHRYVNVTEVIPLSSANPSDRKISLTINDKHDIHHIHERGYVESPVRIKSILKGLNTTDLFKRSEVQTYPESRILEVHDRDYYEYFKRVCRGLEAGTSIYPYVFPIRNLARKPKELSIRAGYYCIDTFTPLNRNAFPASKRAVDCALTCADFVLRGDGLAYALVRPPGHHAGRKHFGGFCYLNSNAIAAHYLSKQGKVAILDLDYHHGNGQQDIFYDRSDVLTISIHGHPSFAYPYFTGFTDEKGEKDGEDHNINIPLKEDIDGPAYLYHLDKALASISRFGSDFLVVALGLDTAKGDPTGTWSLVVRDFESVGRAVGGLKLPTLVVQEGGYKNSALGSNARAFFIGLTDAVYGEGENQGSVPTVVSDRDVKP